MSDQVWGYRLKDGEVEAKIFDGKIPTGWKDTPAKLTKKAAKNDNGK